MDREVERLIAEALKLPPAARATLVDSLIASLDPQVDPDVEAAWAVEIERRIREIDEGRVELVPWSEVRKRLFGR